MIIKPTNLFVGLSQSVPFYEMGWSTYKWDRYAGYPKPIYKFCRHHFDFMMTGIDMDQGDLYQITYIKMRKVK